MKNKYKIVFVDIDDTLYSKDESVSEYTKEIMTELKNKGIKVVANTGRSLQYAINKSIEANLSEYTISSNGAEVYNYQEDKIIFSKPIDAKDVKYIYDYCNSHDLIVILHSFYNRFINIQDDNYNNELATYIKDIDDVLKNNKVNQIDILSTNYERMLALPNLFKEKCPTLRTINSSKDLSTGKREKNKLYYHNLIIENTSKRTGIVELLDYLNIDKSQAITISRSFDDVSIYDSVASTFMVSNLDQRIIDVVNISAKNMKNNGVAKTLKELIIDEIVGE